MIEELKARLRLSSKSNERSLLRTLIGEIERAPTGTNPQKVLHKIVVANYECLKLLKKDDPRTANAIWENDYIQELLPKNLSVEDIMTVFVNDPVLEASLRAAKSEGQAVGLAMKHLKESKVFVEGKDVVEAVKKTRA